MAINKCAKNIRMDISKNYQQIAEEINITAQKIVIYATKDNLMLCSNKKIVINGKK